MKKVININFQGRVVPIEESAYDILKKYVESLTKYFANEDGRDEIINDIESRIAELFAETLKKGSTCITDEDVTRIIESMGRPEDFEDEEAHVKSQLENEQTKSQQENHNTYSSETRKKLFRDENSKVLGGVCAGVANYFGIDPLIVRILFVIFSFGFGFGFITYLVLWIALPSTASTVIGSQRKRLFRDPFDKIIAGVCSGLAHYFGVNVWIPRLLFLIPFISFIFRLGHWGIWDFPHFLSISFSPGATFIYIILWIVFPEAKSAADILEMKGEKVDLNNIKTTIQNDMEGFRERAQQFGNEVKEKAEQIGKNVASSVNTTQNTETVRRVGRGVGDVIVIIAKSFAYFIIGSILFALVAALFGAGVVFTGYLPHKQFILNNGWEDILAWGTLMFFIWVPFIGLVTWIIRRIARMRGNSKLLRSVFIGLWIIGWVCFIGLIASVRNDFRYSNRPEEQTISLSNAKINSLELKAPPHAKYYSNRSWFKLEPFENLDDDTLFIQNTRVRIVKSNTDSFQVTVVKFADGRNRNEADRIAEKINYSIQQIDSSLFLDKGIADNLDVEGWDWRFYEGSKEEHWDHDVEYIQTATGLKRTDNISEGDDNNSSNNSIEEYKKSKEQMLKEKQQKIKELQEIDKQLQTDSSNNRYRYQPSTPKEIKKQSAQIQPTDAAEDVLMMRFTM